MQEVSFAEIMSYAKIAEDNAIAFYQGAAAKAQRPEVKSFLQELVKMEQGHKRHLEELLKKFEKTGKVPKLHKEIHTLGYADYITPVALDADASYKEVLEAAMVKEREPSAPTRSSPSSSTTRTRSRSSRSSTRRSRSTSSASRPSTTT